MKFNTSMGEEYCEWFVCGVGQVGFTLSSLFFPRPASCSRQFTPNGSNIMSSILHVHATDFAFSSLLLRKRCCLARARQQLAYTSMKVIYLILENSPKKARVHAAWLKIMFV